jgi:hypothetical protein
METTSRRRELDGEGRVFVYWLNCSIYCTVRRLTFSLLDGAGRDAEKVSPMVDVFVECFGRPVSPGDGFFQRYQREGPWICGGDSGPIRKR